MNQRAGANCVLLMKDLREADETLSLLLAQGIDINAIDQEAKNWTALHVAAFHPTERVAMLLNHGGRADMRDAEGRTPLDVARRALVQYPDHPHLPATIRLPEQTERR